MKREYVQKIYVFLLTRLNTQYLVPENFLGTSFFIDIESHLFLCYIKIRLIRSIYAHIFIKNVYNFVYTSDWMIL